MAFIESGGARGQVWEDFMLGASIELSIRLRHLMLCLLALLLVGGVVAAQRLPIDAIPDISGIQVSVLTEAPGLSALEVERSVTLPMEDARNGVPGMTELRSVSRADISAITIIFADGTDPWFARQLVFERMLQAKNDLPPTIPTPQIAPLSTRLGEILQSAVRSEGPRPALGSLPMALATGAGSEVQRPLATAVVFGIGASTLMTMFLLPAILKITLRREQREEA